MEMIEERLLGTTEGCGCEMAERDSARVLAGAQSLRIPWRKTKRFFVIATQTLTFLYNHPHNHLLNQLSSQTNRN